MTKAQFIKLMKKEYPNTLEHEIGISIQRSWELRQIMSKKAKELNTHGQVFKWAYNNSRLTVMEKLFVIFIHTQATAENPLQALMEYMRKR